MILIPIGHDRLRMERLPFATMGIILLCVIIYVGSCSRMDQDAIRYQEVGLQYEAFYLAHPYLELADASLAHRSKAAREIYATQREWIRWTEDNPEAAATFLSEHAGTSRGDAAGGLEEFFAAMNPRSGGCSRKHDAAVRLGTDEAAKVAFITAFSALTPEERADEQSTLDGLWKAFEDARAENLILRFGYTPADPSGLALFTYPFLHGGVLHLIMNMLFLWLAAAKLEDRWGRLLFVALYLGFGALAALAHHARHPDALTPLVGASGAVAGLMGAFLVRYATANIRVFYLYWFFRLTPKVGTFEAPAYLLLPLWFIGELLSAFFLEELSSVAYWTHVGGFLSGVAVATVFRLTDFEFRVLGREDESEIDENDVPLVAFQTADRNSLSPRALASSPPRDSLTPGEARLSIETSPPKPPSVAPNRESEPPLINAAGAAAAAVVALPALSQSSSNSSPRTELFVDPAPIDLPPPANDWARDIEPIDIGAPALAPPKDEKKQAPQDLSPIDLPPLPDDWVQDTVPAEDPVPAPGSASPKERKKEVTGDLSPIDLPPLPDDWARNIEAPVERVSSDLKLPQAADSTPSDTSTSDEVVASPVLVVREAHHQKTKRFSPQLHALPLHELRFEEVMLTGITPKAIGARTATGKHLLIPVESVRFLSLVCVDKVDPGSAKHVFRKNAPGGPVHLIALVEGPSGAPPKRRIFIVNATRCRWNAFLPPTLISGAVGQNAVTLARLLRRSLPRAAFIPGSTTSGEDGVPLQDTLAAFIRHLRGALGDTQSE